MSEEKIIIKQSTPIYGTLGIIFGFIGIFILSPLLALALILGFWHVFKRNYSWILSIVSHTRNHHLAHSDGTN